MIEVVVLNGNIEEALKIFREKMAISGLIKEMRSHEYFLTKSQRRRLKDYHAAKRIRQKEERRIRWSDR